MQAISTYAHAKGSWHVGELVEGADAYVMAQAALLRGGLHVFVARDDARAAAFQAAFRVFAPKMNVWSYPAWDCLPYDRVSPSRLVAARRAACLYRLTQKLDGPSVLVTTMAAISQYVPPRDVIAKAGLVVKVGQSLSREKLEQYFTLNGYSRASMVVEPGDFALRGSLVDVFPPGFDEPVRLDFFGDELESIRLFDADTQKSIGTLSDLTLEPVSEVFLDAPRIQRFRSNFIATFGGGQSADPVYASVSQGIRIAGLEHYLPLFYEQMETLFDYVPAQTLWAFDALSDEAAKERAELIADYYQARTQQNQMQGDETRPKALPPSRLYIENAHLKDCLKTADMRLHSPFSLDISGKAVKTMNIGSHAARSFAKERQTEGVNVFEAVAQHLRELSAKGQKVLLACWSAGSSERLGGVLADHELVIGEISAAKPVSTLKKGDIKRLVLPVENGFDLGLVSILSEQDILGDRLIRRGRRHKGKDFIAEVSALSEGDLVIHIDHGLGRYLGLETLSVSEAPHDCLKLAYAGGAVLYLPVENIELLSRYGSAGETVQLDRLGGTAWQSRKARAKKRLRDMAGELIKIAAARALKTCEPVAISRAEYDAFCARFPYAETEDQLSAIADVQNDLASGQPMDRLVCGDVGFGKTEVALRAAYQIAMTGKQVAVITPTTILSRQHFATFSDRFRPLPVKVRQLSRLVSPVQAKRTRDEIANGQCDIVIGTHALLAKSVRFSDLGLVIVDEEQRFGVGHKERLKALKANVHVLTLSATPIPRTLQMALSGIRDLSLIATPPVDRLAVRTFITPWDTVILREALLRERYRGGQSFFVVPRIADLRRCEDFLRQQVPEISYVIAHGQMNPTALEDVMSAFYERKYDVLLSTSIIESGLDIPSANTMVVYRADRFGLAQLYQMRGRVGRSKTRAYAYLTTPDEQLMTKGALQRLKILQSLDTLGAGFNLASHDLDMRGGGNPLGEEQSGHIKDLGVELYQHMLEEAVAELREDTHIQSRSWSPQVNIGVPILIPETYVEDLHVRLSLYRRMSELEDDAMADGFAAELIDRFGRLPQEVGYLLQVMKIKRLARQAKVSKIDAGPRGVVLSFRHEEISSPDIILKAMKSHPNWRLKPDQTVFVRGRLDDAQARLDMVETCVQALVRGGMEAGG